MKKTFKSIILATLGVFAFTCCEDVPAPYEIPGTGKQQTATFYSSSSCSDWSMVTATTGNNPWSQGSSYTQATGYQKWDGADAKSNRMADGYLISPGFSTVTDKDAAYISFQYCVGYANNDAQFADHIKLYASTQYAPADGFVAEKWTQLEWTATHTSTNWELATTTVVLPAAFLNQEKINLAFYFTTPNATKSATFEIKDLKVVAGTPSDNGEGGEGGNQEGTEITCAQAVELTNALADGATSTETYTITGYITEVVGDVSKGQQTFWMADTKDGGRVFEAYWANLPEGVEKFIKGSKVKITGQLMKYVNKSTSAVTPEIKNANVVILEAGDEGGGGQTTEEGTPVTCAQAVELTNALADGGTSTETYTITGYITEVIGSVSTKTGTPQQSFWMADEKDGGQVFQAYYANLPEGVSAFVKGSKVKITGQLMKYVKNGAVTPEIKNATVVILEAGEGGDEGGEGGEGGEQGDTSEYGIGLSYAGGTNFYDNGVATINGVADCKVLKIGTSKAAGDFTLSVPAGKHSFYAVTWKGLGTADVVLKNGEETIQTITVKENDGATQNSPYTLTVTEEDKYEFEVSAACTLTVTSDKRVIFFGIK
jgi:hypothetical protein